MNYDYVQAVSWGYPTRMTKMHLRWYMSDGIWGDQTYCNLPIPSKYRTFAGKGFCKTCFRVAAT